jgi:hypothetical protein
MKTLIRDQNQLNDKAFSQHICQLVNATLKELVTGLFFIVVFTGACCILEFC